MYKKFIIKCNKIYRLSIFNRYLINNQIVYLLIVKINLLIYFYNLCKF